MARVGPEVLGMLQPLRSSGTPVLFAIGSVTLIVIELVVALALWQIEVVDDYSAGLAAALPTTITVAGILLQWFVTQTAPGVLWFHRVRGRGRTVTAEVSIQFEVGELPALQDLVASLQRWDASGRVGSSSRAIEDAWITTGRIGPLNVVVDSTQIRGAVGRGSRVYLVSPMNQRRVGDLLAMIRKDIEPMLDAVADVLGSPEGFDLTVEFRPEQNPFYGAMLRPELGRIGVNNLLVEPTLPYGGNGDQVRITGTSLRFQSRSRGSFSRMVGDFLGFSPLGA